MPIYEYQCQSCQRVIEVLQQMSAKPLKKCESCGGRLDKLLSRTAFVLKGGGWYSDGYGGAKKSAGKAGGSESSKESKPEAKESTSQAKDSKSEGTSAATKTKGSSKSTD
ncbi:MAG: zinc ribbon domain-containing protein [Acidobacteriota bacterium]